MGRSPSPPPPFSSFSYSHPLFFFSDLWEGTTRCLSLTMNPAFLGLWVLSLRPGSLLVLFAQSENSLQTFLYLQRERSVRGIRLFKKCFDSLVPQQHKLRPQGFLIPRFSAESVLVKKSGTKSWERETVPDSGDCTRSWSPSLSMGLTSLILRDEGL